MERRIRDDDFLPPYTALRVRFEEEYNPYNLRYTTDQGDQAEINQPPTSSRTENNGVVRDWVQHNSIPRASPPAPLPNISSPLLVNADMNYSSSAPTLVSRPATPDHLSNARLASRRCRWYFSSCLNRHMVIACMFVLCMMLFFIVFLTALLGPFHGELDDLSSKSLASKVSNMTSLQAPLQSPELGRELDTRDAFADYKYRATCNISSVDLHAPFGSLCPDRKTMLQAMSSGGRIGFDAPYFSRGCDLRWFTTAEICEILSRFRVIIVGDSMMRHLIGSINVMIRRDLGYGAVTDWNFSAQERRDCFCNDQFDVKSCSVQGIYKTADVIKNDPTSFACPAETVDLHIEQINKWPIPTEELSRFRALLPSKKPDKPYVFIFGQGLWNNLNLSESLKWLDEILDNSLSVAPWLKPTHGQRVSAARNRSPAFWPRLFVTPNSAGIRKSDEFLETQGNKKVMEFEEGIRIEAAKRGIEHLGTWNMSIQANKPDGTHCDAKGNLLKAMMVLNWLHLLDVREF